MSPQRKGLRLLLDTNVVIAGLLWKGVPQQLLERAVHDDSVHLFTSHALLQELEETLDYPKFAARLTLFDTSAGVLALHYARLAEVVGTAPAVRVVPGDPDDDHVIAAAVAAAADLIVTGDKRHLLPLGSLFGIDIVTPRQALERLTGDRIG